MTASECISALLYGLRHLLRQQGLSLVQKFWLALLKCVAVIAYYSGKARSFDRPLSAERGSADEKEQPSVCRWNRCSPKTCL